VIGVFFDVVGSLVVGAVRVGDGRIGFFYMSDVGCAMRVIFLFLSWHSQADILVVVLKLNFGLNFVFVICVCCRCVWGALYLLVVDEQCSCWMCCESDFLFFIA
jgi:hypothetical protein